MCSSRGYRKGPRRLICWPKECVSWAILTQSSQRACTEQVATGIWKALWPSHGLRADTGAGAGVGVGVGVGAVSGLRRACWRAVSGSE